MADKKTIKLTVTKRDKPSRHAMRFCVDDPTLPGSPMVGYGASIAEAIGNWVIGNAEYAGVRLELTPEARAFADHSNATKIGLHR